MILQIAECLGPRNGDSQEESVVQDYLIHVKVDKEPLKTRMEMPVHTT